MSLQVDTIIGQYLTIEPLQRKHEAQLETASKDDRIWAYHSENAEPASRFEKWFGKAITQHQSGESFVFVVKLNQNNKVVGSSRYYDISPIHKRLTIGFTWYNPECWASYVNPECKLLMLKNAFEQLGMQRVSFEVDSRNKRSLSAMIKLRAREEGVLRKHIVLGDGYIRDTVLFSIIDDEWPKIKLELEKRLKTIEL